MSEFLAVDLTNKAPSDVICPDCAKQGILHVPTQAVLVHCEHQISGAYQALGRDWTILRGIEGSHFKDSAVRGLLMGELRLDVERGLTGLIQNEANNSVKH